MKKYLVHELKKQLGRKSHTYRSNQLKKKLVYFAALAVFGVVLLGGLATWGAVTLVSRLANGIQVEQAQNVVQESQQWMQAVGSKPIVSQSCLNTVTSLLMSPSKWLTVPLVDSVNSVASSCFNEGQLPKAANESGKAEDL